MRKQRLRDLSAYDVAKLAVVFPESLYTQEMEVYMNPLRDFFDNMNEVQALEDYGMKLVLLGNDILTLRHLLDFSEEYISTHGDSRKL